MPARQICLPSVQQEGILVGQSVGHYQLTAELGRGTSGTVYEAVDTRLDRKVALKFLSADLRDDERLEARLKREARLLASLNPMGAKVALSSDGRTVYHMTWKSPLTRDVLTVPFAGGPSALHMTLENLHSIGDFYSVDPDGRLTFVKYQPGRGELWMAELR